MTLENNWFYKWIVQEGWTDITCVRWKQTYFRNQDGEFNHHVDFREFQKGDLNIFVDMGTIFIYKNKKLLKVHVAFHVIPFNGTHYPEIPYHVLSIITPFRKPISADTRDFILQRDNYRCVKCNSRLKLEIDHIVPISRGGDNDIDNLQTLCKTCNVRKSNKLAV